MNDDDNPLMRESDVRDALIPIMVVIADAMILWEKNPAVAPTQAIRVLLEMRALEAEKEDRPVLEQFALQALLKLLSRPSPEPEVLQAMLRAREDD